MLVLILDTFVLVALIRLITGEEEDGFGKPAIIALGASVTLFVASFGVADASARGGAAAALVILIASILGVGMLVAIGCVALLDIDLSKSAMIGGAFIAYKIAISLVFNLILS